MRVFAPDVLAFALLNNITSASTAVNKKHLRTTQQHLQVEPAPVVEQNQVLQQQHEFSVDGHPINQEELWTQIFNLVGPPVVEKVVDWVAGDRRLKAVNTPHTKIYAAPEQQQQVAQAAAQVPADGASHTYVIDGQEVNEEEFWPALIGIGGALAPKIYDAVKDAF